MCMDREQENFVSSYRQGSVTFTALYAEWLQVLGKIETGNDVSIEGLPPEDLTALQEREMELARIICATPAQTGRDVLQKFHVLEHYHDESSWTDKIDIRLVASIKVDLMGFKMEAE